MTPLVLALLCAAPPAAADPKPKTPPPSEMAILYFLAGDLRRAVDTARAGIKSEPARCKALYPMLVEYEFLVPRRESLTLAEAKAFIAWDRQISPKAPGKLSAVVYKRYVDMPLQYARTARAGGEGPKASKLVAEVLEVDPLNADALALRAQLGPQDGGR